MNGTEKTDFQRDDFIEAKRRLTSDVIAEIVAERLTFVGSELGRDLAPLGAVRESTAGADDAQWMIDPEFRDFLKRSV